MTTKYIVEQRMGSKTWEYRTTENRFNDAVQFILDHNSVTYPHRIKRVESTVIFEENTKVVSKRKRVKHGTKKR